MRYMANGVKKKKVNIVKKNDYLLNFDKTCILGVGCLVKKNVKKCGRAPSTLLWLMVRSSSGPLGLSGHI